MYLVNLFLPDSNKHNTTMTKRLFILISAALLLLGCKAAVENPILTIEGGQVQGVTTDIEGVYVYRGIPYAAPPIGENRWKAPQPVIPWEGVKIADKFGHPAFQGAHYPGGYTTEWSHIPQIPPGLCSTVPYKATARVCGTGEQRSRTDASAFEVPSIRPDWPCRRTCPSR